MSSLLFCPIRKRALKATPEEQVRCQLLSLMIGELAYPYSLISVERKLHEFLPLVGQKTVPNRRIDILCYSKELKPLLLIECKKKPPSKNVVSQILGYNYYIQAPFVAVVSSSSAYVVSASGSPFLSSLHHLPSFAELSLIL